MLSLPCPIHGGKFYMMDLLNKLYVAPKWRTIETCGGSGRFILTRQCKNRIYNDINWRRTMLMTVVKYYSPILSTCCYALGSPDPVTFQRCKQSLSAWKSEPSDWESRIGLSADYMAVIRWSRGKMGKDFSVTRRLRREMNELHSSWYTAIHDLPKVSELCNGVLMMTWDAIDWVKQANENDFLYIDPPYWPGSRTAPLAYGESDCDEEWHKRLLCAIVGCPARIMLSGYRNEVYDGCLNGWWRHEKELVNHSGQDELKQTRKECVWINYLT